MTELAAASIVARVSALAWALVSLQRTQDGRVLRLFVGIAALTAWQVTALAVGAEWFSSFALVSDLGSLALSAGLLLAVPFLEGHIGRERKRHDREEEVTEQQAALESRRETVLRARARQQEAVANLGRRVLASSNLESAIEDAVHTAARALEVAGCGFFEYVPASRSLILSAGGGSLAPFTRNAITAAPEHQLGISVTEGSRLVVADFDTRGSPRRPPLLPYVASRSGVSVVALGSDSTFGVLAALAREPDRFTEEDAHFLQGIANLLASAIERDRTLRELDRGREKVYQAQKLEALGTLSGGIAHDFNNMLQAIVGHTQLALGETREGTAQQNLRQVLIAAQRARELTSQVLTFGQRTRPQRVRIEIRPIVEEVVGLMRATVPPNLQIQTRIEVPNASVHADSIQLYQVLVNLCTNAAQALRGKAGGLLEIGVDIDTAARSQSGQSFVRLWVRDNGPGIRPEVRARIFEPFFSARVDGNGPGDGTGMGLAVVHGIVQAHGGSIRVESEPGCGATFFVLLPNAEPVSLRAPAGAPTTQKAGATILFVDDEPALVSMAKQGLSAEGYEVVGMTSSMQALEEFRRDPHRYRLVLMDQNMPGLKGEALAKELLAIRKDLPIILCTGYADEWTPEQALALGVREYLTKPISLDALAAIVRRTLS